MLQAVRSRDGALVSTAVLLFKRHVELCWDYVYGGFFRSLDDVDRNVWTMDKVVATHRHTHTHTHNTHALTHIGTRAHSYTHAQIHTRPHTRTHTLAFIHTHRPLIN